MISQSTHILTRQTTCHDILKKISLLISLGRNRLAHSPKNISNQGGPSSFPSADGYPQDNRENIYLDRQYRGK